MQACTATNPGMAAYPSGSLSENPKAESVTAATCVGRSDTATPVTDKKQLREYLISASDLLEDNNPTGCCPRLPKPIKLIDQSVSQFKVPDKRAPDILPDFIGSRSGQRLHRKAAASNFTSIENTMRVEGVDINAPSKKSGNTPLISAALNNHWEMVGTLLDSAPPGSVAAVNKMGQDLLQLLLTGTAHKALGADFAGMLKKIVSNGCKDRAFSAYALKLVAERCDASLLDVARKAIPDNSHHPLRNKLFAEKLLRITAGINSDKSKVISYILSLKNCAGFPLVDPNAACDRGFTALMKASSIGKTDNVKCLLKDGRVKGQINKENPKKPFAWTAYTSAHYHGCRVTMGILRDHGAIAIPARSTLVEEQRAREARSNTSGGGGMGGFMLDTLISAITDGGGVGGGFGGSDD